MESVMTPQGAATSMGAAGASVEVARRVSWMRTAEVPAIKA